MSLDIEIEEEFAQRKLTRRTLSRLWKFMKPYKVPLLVTVVLEVFWVLLFLSGPLLIGWAIDGFLIPSVFEGIWVVAALNCGALLFMKHMVMN